MQSADSSLGLSWWLLYQMPGKLQGFRTFRTTWLRLEPDCLLATAYVEFIYTLRRQIAQAFWLLSVKDQRLHRRQCSPIYAAQYIRLSSRAPRGLFRLRHLLQFKRQRLGHADHVHRPVI